MGIAGGEVKPFSQACENNQEPIVAVLERVFTGSSQVLEIGSGTGQHSIYFAPRLPHLSWQTTDLTENHSAINAWIDDYPAPNLLRPLTLDVGQPEWPDMDCDAVFTANSCHIMPWQGVEAMFVHLGKLLVRPAVIALYGPFKYGGEFTSASNARFDEWLKQRAGHQGIRDFEAVATLAEKIGFKLIEDNSMPANNQLLVFGTV